MLRASGVLHADFAHPARVQHETEQRRRLRHPGDDHDALGVRDHAPAASQQLGERRTQPGEPARVGIAELVVRQLGQHPALRGRPRGAREQ